MMESLQKLRNNDVVHLCLTAFSVIGSLLVYGVLQEKLMNQSFGKGENFDFSLFPVLCNRCLQCFIAAGIIVIKRDWAALRPVAPLYAYAAVSFSNVVATTCQYEALKYLTFPVQTLGKCGKMFPVMIWGVLILRKTYKVKDYLVAVCITAGCAMFILTGPFKSKRSPDSSDAGLFGGLLMLGYLMFDGFTSTFQDKMFSGYNMTTFNQVLYTSMWSAVLCCVGLMFSGSFLPAVSFATRHPDALTAIIIISIAATVGSLCISYTIKTFGALVFATIMTTRQLLSIFTSNMIFSRAMSLGQWFAVSMVFCTLYYQALTKTPKPKKEYQKVNTDEPKAGLPPHKV